MVRSALLLPGPGLTAIATVLFDGPDQPELAEAMALVSSLSVELAPSRPPAAGPFAFTVPQSRVVVKVPDIGLRPDTGPRRGTPPAPTTSCCSDGSRP